LLIILDFTPILRDEGVEIIEQTWYKINCKFYWLSNAVGFIELPSKTDEISAKTKTLWKMGIFRKIELTIFQKQDLQYLHSS
jgi:hypothetical protein